LPHVQYDLNSNQGVVKYVTFCCRVVVVTRTITLRDSYRTVHVVCVSTWLINGHVLLIRGKLFVVALLD